MEGRSEPRLVFDRIVDPNGVADGYSTMNDREALKVFAERPISGVRNTALTVWHGRLAAVRRMSASGGNRTSSGPITFGGQTHSVRRIPLH